MIFSRYRNYRANLGVGRIEAFSDGVFAIAITLLVLGITLPELTVDEVHRGEMAGALLALWPKFISFVISFSVIGIFWSGHHLMFHYIKRADRVFLWLNSLLLMAVSFIPFPASLLGQYGADRAVVVLYGSTLFFAGMFFYLVWHYASRKRRLVRSDLERRIIVLGKKVIVAAPITYALAIALAFINPLFSIGIYILVPLAYVIPSPVDELVHFCSEEV